MKNSKIKSIKAREILDSRGNPTVEVDLTIETGKFRASVPSGVSKGKYEAVELRDGGKRYGGKGVLKAVKNVNEIITSKLKSEDVSNQKKIDQILIELDGTENKSRLGANAILAVSMACCRAGAGARNIPLWKYISQIAETKKPFLPSPALLLIEGGLHAGNALDIQEFMIVPESDSFGERLRIGTEIYHTLGAILKKKYGEFATNVGYEGGFAAPLRSSAEGLDLIMAAIEKTGYTKTKIILDIAASTFYQDGIYKFEGITFTKDGFLSFYADLLKKYPIIALEDPFSEEDWSGFQNITEKFSPRINIIGDDLLATNIQRIKEALSKKACNGLILKPNQIGTVSETITAAKLAQDHNWKVFVKHRSAETNDDFIADLAVGLGTGWIMAGAPSREERLAKYNRLLRIEEQL